MDNKNISPTNIHTTDQGQNSQKQKTKTIHTYTHTHTYETPQSLELHRSTNCKFLQITKQQIWDNNKASE